MKNFEPYFTKHQGVWCVAVPRCCTNGDVIKIIKKNGFESIVVLLSKVADRGSMAVFTIKKSKYYKNNIAVFSDENGNEYDEEYDDQYDDI